MGVGGMEIFENEIANLTRQQMTLNYFACHILGTRKEFFYRFIVADDYYTHIIIACDDIEQTFATLSMPFIMPVLFYKYLAACVRINLHKNI